MNDYFVLSARLNNKPSDEPINNKPTSHEPTSHEPTVYCKPVALQYSGIPDFTCHLIDEGVVLPITNTPITGNLNCDVGAINNGDKVQIDNGQSHGQSDNKQIDKATYCFYFLNHLDNDSSLGNKLPNKDNITPVLLLSANIDEQALSYMIKKYGEQFLTIGFYIHDFKDGRVFSLINQLKTKYPHNSLICGHYSTEQVAYFYKLGVTYFIADTAKAQVIKHTIYDLSSSYNGQKADRLPMFL